ncbi:hypothetical protein HYS97_03320 [Candidatus Daviesbacteria bacterium]|nr:hypothetical protein [Candidatus Daviesbacteria bacterium]
MSIEIKIRPGITEIAAGVKAKVGLLRRKLRDASETALHETEHLLTLLLRRKGFRRATINPGPGYLGMVEPYEYDAPSFAAPAARCRGGVGHDLAVVAAMGDDIGIAKSVANSTLAGNERKLLVVASRLEEEGEITQTDAERAIDDDANPFARIEILGPNVNRKFEQKTWEQEGHLVSIELADFELDSHPLAEKVNGNILTFRPRTGVHRWQEPELKVG